jgi:hypothetical protein
MVYVFCAILVALIGFQLLDNDCDVDSLGSTFFCLFSPALSLAL